MKVGTKSLLFGVHQFLLHPFFVAIAWYKLYGLPVDPRLWVAFFVHDLGYLGKPNMDGPEGERHPEFGAAIMHALFDWPRIVKIDYPSGARGRQCNYKWLHFCLFHSRFYARKACCRYSRLCVADKLAIALMPKWIYLPLAKLSGELDEVMVRGGNTLGYTDPNEWHKEMTAWCRSWAYRHKDGDPDYETRIRNVDGEIQS